MPKALIAFDTDRIKEYVFSTNKLREIRGASALLDDLNRYTMPQIVKGEKIYANGGSGLFVVDQDQAQQAIWSVEKAYLDGTKTASITGVAADIQSDTDIKQLLSQIRHLLRISKDSPPSEIPLVTHPFMRYCDSCGVQYASIKDSDEEGKLICQSCLAKREKDEIVKNDVQQLAAGHINHGKMTSLWKKLISELQADGYPVKDHTRPLEFSDIGELSNPSGYLGIIYADGDSMGKNIEQIDNLEEMKLFSEGIDEAIYQSVKIAILKHLQPDPNKKIWPFDILLLGGDDLVMVTRADKAIMVASTIIENFSEITLTKIGKSLSLSASVIISHQNFPFRSLLNLAETSLKVAKKKGSERRQHGETITGGLLNFLVVNSSNHLDFNTYYNQVLTQEEGRNKIIRTHRPYTINEMKALLEKVTRIQNIPRTKMEQLRSAVFLSQKQAILESMMILLRMHNESHRVELLDLISKERGKQANFPWIKTVVKDGYEFKTPILDVVELLDFIS